MYFLFSKLRGWGKPPAIRPQTQLCGVALSFLPEEFMSLNSIPPFSGKKPLLYTINGKARKNRKNRNQAIGG